MSHPEKLELYAQRVILLVVGVAAGAASFTHMHDWTMTHSPDGTRDWFGWANACISELVPVAALLKIRQLKREGRSITYPLCLLLAGAVLSLAAQLAVAKPSPSGWLLSAVPAVAFIALSKLILSGAAVEETENELADIEEETRPPRMSEELHMEPDPWGHDTPSRIPEELADARATPTPNVVKPQPRPDISIGSTDDQRRPSAPRVRPRSLTSAAVVLAAAASLAPNASTAEIAAKAKVSESTVRRYLPRPRRAHETAAA